MSQLKAIKNAGSKVVRLDTQQKAFSDFFTPYGDQTQQKIINSLDRFYQAYQKTTTYQYLSFAEKVDVEFRYQLLRNFIQGLKR